MNRRGIARLRSRSAPRSLSPASGRCPQPGAMLPRPSFSRSQARLGGAHQDAAAVLAPHDLVLVGVAHGRQLVAVELDAAALALARLEHRRTGAPGLRADAVVEA